MDTTTLKESPALQLSTAAISALHHGNKIEAIKIVREERHIGLKEAKDVVDDYVRSHPGVQSSLAAAQIETKRRALLWLVGPIVLAILGYYFLTTP